MDRSAFDMTKEGGLGLSFRKAGEVKTFLFSMEKRLTNLSTHASRKYQFQWGISLSQGLTVQNKHRVHTSIDRQAGDDGSSMQREGNSSTTDTRSHRKKVMTSGLKSSQ